jgi:hypothetical protein
LILVQQNFSSQNFQLPVLARVVTRPADLLRFKKLFCRKMYSSSSSKNEFHKFPNIEFFRICRLKRIIVFLCKILVIKFKIFRLAVDCRVVDCVFATENYHIQTIRNNWFLKSLPLIDTNKWRNQPTESVTTLVPAYFIKYGFSSSLVLE